MCRAQLARADDERLAAIEAPLHDGIDAVEQAVRFIVGSYGSDAKKPSVGAVPFMELLGIVAGGWQMARAALVSLRRLQQGDADAGFLRTRVLTARFYADHMLPRAGGLARAVVSGAEAALAIDEDNF